MRIDSSGNLLVGKTTVGTSNTVGHELKHNGITVHTTSGTTAMYLNRKGNDGDVLEFRKDGSTVGIIQARGGDLVIGTGDTGIRFNDSDNAVMPHHATDVVNNQIDIGHSSYKFKDLHLSGTANANALNIKSGSAIHGTITTSSSSLTLNARNTGVMLFQSGGSEKARIDVSGNLLVGTTNAANASAGFRAYAGGNGAFTKASTVLDLNRLSTDGTIIQFQKDTVNVGTIGTVSNGKLMMGVGGSSGTNLIFADAFDEIYPSQNGVTTLGDPGAKFKDLHLSGTAHIGHAVIDDYAVNTSATSAAQVDTFAAATFRTARYTIQITNTTDSTYHVTELLLIHDGTTPSITEYGTIYTGSAEEATFDADIVSGNVRLLATPASTDTMQFKVVRHSILV